VPHCWILDPEAETAWQYDGGSEVTQAAELVVGQFRLSVEKIFSVFHQ
jgi:hypothetical protein